MVIFFCYLTNQLHIYYDPLPGANDQVTCSLGYLHYLPSVKRFCSADQILNVGPTKHNVLCKGQSALDVILGHEDFLQQRGRSSLAPAETIEDVKRIDPEIKVVSANIMSLTNSVLKRSCFKIIVAMNAKAKKY